MYQNTQNTTSYGMSSTQPLYPSASQNTAYSCAQAPSFAGSAAYTLQGAPTTMYSQEDSSFKNLTDAYEGVNESVSSFQKNTIQETSFTPSPFLLPGRQPQKFIGKAKEIQQHIEETFQKLTGTAFPADINIIIGNKNLFQEQGVYGNGIVGFAINRSQTGLVSEVFVLNDELDKVMLTLGHELGHVLTKKLGNIVDEEAKAFAFSYAWMRTIKKNNIANLENSFTTETPAKNGVHDKAHEFVIEKLASDKDPLELYHELARKETIVQSLCALIQ